MASNAPSSATKRTDATTLSVKYQPDFIDRVALPLGRCEALAGVLWDFIEVMASDREEVCHGDALVYVLQLELVGLRQVLETAIDAELPKPVYGHLLAAYQRHGISADSLLAVVEILDTGTDRPDFWESEATQRLLTVTKRLEG